MVANSTKRRPRVARRRSKRFSKVEINSITSKYEAGATQVGFPVEFSVNRKAIVRHLGRLPPPAVIGQNTP